MSDLQIVIVGLAALAILAVIAAWAVHRPRTYEKWVKKERM